ncbi:hypothetical protein KM043_012657 [Ampulex compressa]|nr:hypothetical protein KM043_012657 [Ampulex compressa]
MNTKPYTLNHTKTPELQEFGRSLARVSSGSMAWKQEERQGQANTQGGESIKRSNPRNAAPALWPLRSVAHFQPPEIAAVRRIFRCTSVARNKSLAPWAGEAIALSEEGAKGKESGGFEEDEGMGYEVVFRR